MSAIQHALFEALPEPFSYRAGRADVRTIDAASILTPGKGRLEHFDFSLNPYRGCGFGCTYCYAAFFVPEEVKRESWGEWVEVKGNALNLLSRAKGLNGSRILMSSVTDPYQPLEAATRLTRSILEFLSKIQEQPRIVIQTRGPLVCRDIDVLKRFRHLRVNMSITTDCDEVRKKFEPACASIERRLRAIEELRDAGISTGICVSPMLPIMDPIGFARTLKELKPDKFAAKYFHLSDRSFTSGTRKQALRIADEMGWTPSKFRRTIDLLKSLVPGFDGAWEPV